MQWRNGEDSYGSPAKFFHWLIFLLIATLLAVGFLMTDMANTPDKFFVYGLHKSIGVVVLSLAILRLCWKLNNITPRLPNTMRAIEKLGAHGMHWLLYALMLAMPLSGWLMSSASGFPVSVFGLFTLPDLVPPDKELKVFFKDAHELIAYLIIFCVLMHALAALLHHYRHKDNVLLRMLPFYKEKIHAQDIDTGAGR